MSQARKMRRARERAEAKAAERRPTLIAGEGVVAATLPGHVYEAKPFAQLPPKVPGQHRFIVSASWIASPALIDSAFDADLPKLLDHENLQGLAIGCWDCELVLQPDDAPPREGATTRSTPCPGDPSGVDQP